MKAPAQQITPEATIVYLKAHYHENLPHHFPTSWGTGDPNVHSAL